MTQREAGPRLEALIDAQISRQAGRPPRDAKLAALSDRQLAREIENTCALLELSDDEKEALLSGLRAEAKQAAAPRGSVSRAGTISRARDVSGALRFKPLTSWVLSGMFSFVSLAMFAAHGMALVSLPPLLIALMIYFHGRRGVQKCIVDGNRSISVIQGSATRQLDLTQYQHIRMYASGEDQIVPTMLLFEGRSSATFWSFVSSYVFPKVSDQRIVLFFNHWNAEDGAHVTPVALEGVFREACERAGLKPQPIEGSLFHAPGWEVRR